MRWIEAVMTTVSSRHTPINELSSKDAATLLHRSGFLQNAGNPDQDDRSNERHNNGADHSSSGPDS